MMEHLSIDKKCQARVELVHDHDPVDNSHHKRPSCFSGALFIYSATQYKCGNADISRLYYFLCPPVSSIVLSARHCIYTCLAVHGSKASYLISEHFKYIISSLLLGFWTLSIVRNSINKKTQRFRNWICFSPQVRVEHLLY
jgi:hypothetical protein